MESVLEKYILDSVDYEQGIIEFSSSKLEISIKKGEVFQGSFQVKNSLLKEMHAELFTSSLRLTCDKYVIDGAENTIQYLVDSSGLEEGDAVKGEISVVSSNGEYYLPFVIHIEHSKIATSEGDIKNLFHFTNLAKLHWEEAVALFYTKEFRNIFTGNDKQYLKSYRGFFYSGISKRNVDEFLVEINKKQQVEYLIQQEEISIDYPSDIVHGEINVIKNGWGDIHLEVICKDEFISTDKIIYTEDDFLGNTLAIMYYVDPEKLHAGNNYGTIKISTPLKSVELPIYIKTRESKALWTSVHKEKALITGITDYYLKFRLKKIAKSEWLDQSLELVEDIVLRDENHIAARLYQAQLLMTKERYNEGKWVLNHVQNLFQNQVIEDDLYCYYLYLTTLYERDEQYVNSTSEEIERIFRRNKNNWRIAWLLLYLNEEYTGNPIKRWALLEEEYEAGCISPVLLLEGAVLLRNHTNLLTTLSGYSLHVLLFIVKHEMILDEILPQILYLFQTKREDSKHVLNILSYFYQVTKQDDVLQAICMYYMKQNNISEEAFPWYERAVEHKLRITKLYDYYMLSLPLDEQIEIPKIVMMYFAYESNLPYERNAYLYANIVKLEDSMPEMYQSYKNRISTFIVEQIMLGHCNRELAYLYQTLLNPDIFTEELAYAFTELLFLHEITVEHEDMKRVIVVHDRLNGEVRYPIHNRKAQIQLYGSDYEIFLEDDKGNRYTKSVSYTLEKRFLPRKYVRILQPIIKQHLGFCIFICENIHSTTAISEENAAQFLCLLQSEQVRTDYKKEIRIKLIQYYYDHDKMRELDFYLADLTYEGTDAKERNEIIRYMVIRGMYETATSWITQFGMEGIDSKVIMRLAIRLIRHSQEEENDILLAMAYFSFEHGTYEENILRYLIKFYRGTTKELRNIYKASIDFEVDTFELCERIILQILFTKAYVSEMITIFEDYCKRGARTDIKVAFLSYCSYDYFAKERIMEGFIFKEMLRIKNQQEELPLVCELALLRYFSEEGKAQVSEYEELIESIIIECLQKGIYFEFFLEFSAFVPSVKRLLNDKTLVEYRTNPNSRVVIHYVCQVDDNETQEYKKTEMKHMFGGIYSKAFVLFFGESLQYYITEEQNGAEQLTQSDTIRKSDMVREEEENKFSLLNDIVLSKTLQDYDTLDKLSEEYERKSYLVKEIFQIE